MTKLERYQAYADRCADKLSIPHATLRWSGQPCRVKPSSHAHCHIADGIYPRGTICLNRRWFAEAGAREWHHCIAHEVAHLAVKSPHGSATFDRRMVALGVANYSERTNARSARKGHHHIWQYWHTPAEGNHQRCRVCGKRNK